MSGGSRIAAVLLAFASCIATAASSDELEMQQVGALRAALGEPRYLLFAYGRDHHARAYDIAARAFALDALQRAGARLDVQAAIAAGLIEAQLRAGLDADALETFDRLAAPLRERMLHGAAVCASTDDAPYVALEFHPRVVGGALAMALANAGRGEEARTMLAALDPFVPFADDAWDCDLGAPAAVLPHCVSALIGAAPFDPYGWRFGSEGLESERRCATASDARGYLRVAEAKLEAAGLPEAWRLAFDANDDPASYDSDQDELDRAVARDPASAPAIAALRPRLATADARDAALVARYRRREQDEDQSDAPAAPPSDADRELARTLRQRIAATLYDPYRADPIERAQAGADKRAPCGEGVLHCAFADGARWELYVSQDLDPTGEVPAAGYWLRRRDGDAAQAYYLGMREHQPYVLSPAASMPLVENGVLQLVMDVKQLDPESITFPPMALRFEDGVGAVRITAPIAAIVRDTDGDGLTDLVEQRLLLDPQAADSDGDGLDDGADPMPNVARRTGAGERSRAMAAALHVLQQGGDVAISFGVEGSDDVVQRRATSQRTMFLHADPESVAALDPAARLIVLPLDLDLAQLRKRPGYDVFYPTWARLDHVDGADTATLTWSSRSSGGTLALYRRDGRWHAAMLSMWVT